MMKVGWEKLWSVFRDRAQYGKYMHFLNAIIEKPQCHLKINFYFVMDQYLFLFQKTIEFEH